MWWMKYLSEKSLSPKKIRVSAKNSCGGKAQENSAVLQKNINVLFYLALLVKMTNFSLSPQDHYSEV